MLTLVLAVLSSQLCAAAVSPLVPAIASEFGVGLGPASAVMSLFFVGSAVGGVVIARWSDAVGRRKALLFVLALVGAGTILCAVAPSFPLFLAGRATQGLGIAAFPLSYLIVREELSPQLFGVGIGLLTACNGGILGLDGVFGGAISGAYGVRAVFWVLLSVPLLAFAGVLISIPKAAGTGEAMDWPGALAITIVLVAASQAVSALSARRVAEAALAVAVAAVAATVFLVIERSSHRPMIPLRFARQRTFWPVLVATFFSLAALQPVVTYTVALMAQNPLVGFSMTPTAAALHFLMPAALSGVLVAPLAGRAAQRLGWVHVLRAGLLIGVAAVGTLVFGATSLPVVVICSALVGAAANGVVLTAVNGLGVVQSPPAAPASLPALNGAAFGLGISTGIMLVAAPVASGSRFDFVQAFLISGVLAALALASTLLIRSPADLVVQGRTRRPQQGERGPFRSTT